jgi:hypothetical protein
MKKQDLLDSTILLLAELLKNIDVVAMSENKDELEKNKEKIINYASTLDD